MSHHTYEAQTAPSKAKGLIYQEDAGRPLTPVSKGTRGPAGGMQAQQRPFATADGADDMYGGDFHPIERKTSVTGKAAADAIDPMVYRNNRSDNARNMAEQKLRNRGGGFSPYATTDVDGPSAAFASKDYHMQQGQKQLPDKIGAAMDFDAEIYRKSRAEHIQQQEDSRQKNSRGGAAPTGGTTAPFATNDSDESRQLWQRTDYHAKQGQKSYADKIGADRNFDPNVYSTALAANRQHQANSSLRNFTGSGDILEFKPSGH